MLYFNIALNKHFKWFFFLLTPVVFFLAWQFFLKPYEVKRLKKETTKTADKLVNGFSSRSLEDLKAIEILFSSIKQKHQQDQILDKTHENLIHQIDNYFKTIHGLEAFVLPPVGNSSALVLFNPYAVNPQALVEETACTRTLKEAPERFKKYKKISFLPVNRALCVYDPNLDMFAVLNLRTTLDEQLKAERMRGYFLALLEEQLPPLVPSKSNFSWVHSRPFSFLGTDWMIHVYPSSAYIDSRFRRISVNFFLFAVGALGFWLWFLRRKHSSQALDAHYVAHLKQLALYDGVTNLPNRTHCLQHLKIVLKRAIRCQETFSVCFMDCDDFKKINDEYGHAIGDRVLRHIADEVSQMIRANDFFARFSGDEFCLILENTSMNKDLKTTLNKILKAISTPMVIEEHIIRISMSIGVAIYPLAGESADSLLKHADEAMYTAKRNQKNKYIIYSDAD